MRLSCGVTQINILNEIASKALFFYNFQFQNSSLGSLSLRSFSHDKLGQIHCQKKTHHNEKKFCLYSL